MSRRRSKSTRQIYAAGPFKAVHNNPEPFGESEDVLVDALNVYLADTLNGSSAYARPGFLLQNGGVALAGVGQCVHVHTDTAQGVTDWIVAGGKLYRVDNPGNVFTGIDVTPAGIIIAPTGRVYLTSFNGQLIVSDGVHRPWVASNLQAPFNAPITGTPISFDGSATEWSAYGQPEVYAGSLMFILNSYNSVPARTDIAWSAPGNPAVGYQQPNYDFRWTLQQTSSDPIYALAATNLALYYFRKYSIGALTGTPATAGSSSGSDFRNASSHDAVSSDVGCLQSATIKQYGSKIFFCDVKGRPWMLPLGGQPVPIWMNCRDVIDDANTANGLLYPAGFPERTALRSCAAVDPTLGLYVVAAWPARPAFGDAPAQLLVFDAKTGVYMGNWAIMGPGVGSTPNMGTSIEAIGTLYDPANGATTLAIVGSKNRAPASPGGFVWVASGTISQWTDNDLYPSVYVTTPRLGESARMITHLDRLSAIAGTGASVTATVRSPALQALQGVAAPPQSSDATYHSTFGLDVVGRGVQVSVAPSFQPVNPVGTPSTDPGTQWVLHRVEAEGVTELASWDDA